MLSEDRGTAPSRNNRGAVLPIFPLGQRNLIHSGSDPCSVLAQIIILIMEERTDVSNSGGPCLGLGSGKLVCFDPLLSCGLICNGAVANDKTSIRT